MTKPWRKISPGALCPIVFDDGTLCGEPVVANGLCNMHNQRRANGSSLTAPRLKPFTKGDPCPIVLDDGSTCGNPISVAGMCRKHYERKRKGLPMGWIRSRRPESCEVVMDDGEPCDRKPQKRDTMCSGHRTRKREGRPMGAPWERSMPKNTGG